MQPSDGFWEGVGTSVGSSPGWMVIGALLVVGIEESKLRSRSMGDQVSAIEQAAAHTSETVDDTNAKVTDIHQRTRDIYNILNGRGN